MGWPGAIGVVPKTTSTALSTIRPVFETPSDVDVPVPPRNPAHPFVELSEESAPFPEESAFRLNDADMRRKLDVLSFCFWSCSEYLPWYISACQMVG